MEAFQQDNINSKRLIYQKGTGESYCYVSVKPGVYNIVLKFDICSEKVGKCRDKEYSSKHEIELYKENHIYIKNKYREKLNISLCEDDRNIDEVTIFRWFLKESNEILELTSFIDDDKAKIILCKALIELLEENNLSLSQAYSYTYLNLLELNLKLTGVDEPTDDSYNALSKWLSAYQDSRYAAAFESKLINREDEINKAILEKGKLKLNLKNDRFKNLIKNTAINWHLKTRYDLWRALRLLWSVDKMQALNCLLPRMFSAIIVGYIPLVMQSDAWKLAYCMYYHNTVWAVMPLLLILSFAYLCIEIGRISINKWKSRALSILGIGLFEALFVGFIVCPFVSRYFSPKTLSIEEKIIEEAIEIVPFWGYPQAFLLFFPLALFIGIFVQIIWEDKPVSEPL